MATLLAPLQPHPQTEFRSPNARLKKKPGMARKGSAGTQVALVEDSEFRFVAFKRPVSGHMIPLPIQSARLADAVETSIKVCETQSAGIVRGEEAVWRVGTTVALFEETKYMCALFLFLGSLQYHRVLPVAGRAASPSAAISTHR